MWQCDNKLSAAAGPVPRTNFSAVRLHNAPADGESQSNAALPVGNYSISAKEFIEHFLLATNWQTGSIIGNLDFNTIGEVRSDNVNRTVPWSIANGVLQ